VIGVFHLASSMLYDTVLNNIALYVYVTFCLFNQKSVGCFYLVGIVNNAVINMVVTAW
jgi:hypothetical protein